MKRLLLLLIVAALTVAGCASDSSDPGDEAQTDTGNETMDDSGDAGGSDSGGSVVDMQPPGTGYAAVDGVEFTLTEPGGVACSIGNDAVTFSFIMGDNEVVLGGGANRFEDGWLGSIDLRIANPTSEPGPIGYFPDLVANGDGIAISGSSMSYEGPMMKQPANDGSNPAPVDAGSGTISVTCP